MWLNNLLLLFSTAISISLDSDSTTRDSTTTDSTTTAQTTTITEIPETETPIPPLSAAPYHVSLQRMNYPYEHEHLINSRHFCSGGLIRLNVVLTAGHCLRFPVYEIAVKGGILIMNKNNSEVQMSRIIDYVIHPNFNTQEPTSPFDLGLVLLQTPFEYTEAVQTIPVATDCYVGDDEGILQISGWEPKDNKSDLVLRVTKMPTTSLDTCYMALALTTKFPELSELQLCTESTLGFGIPCRSDYGGPAVKNGNIVGIKSFHCDDCILSECPSVYTRVCLLFEYFERVFAIHNERLETELEEL